MRIGKSITSQWRSPIIILTNLTIITNLTNLTGDGVRVSEWNPVPAQEATFLRRPTKTFHGSYDSTGRCFPWFCCRHCKQSRVHIILVMQWFSLSHSSTTIIIWTTRSKNVAGWKTHQEYNIYRTNDYIYYFSGSKALRKSTQRTSAVPLTLATLTQVRISAQICGRKIDICFAILHIFSQSEENTGAAFTMKWHPGGRQL